MGGYGIPMGKSENYTAYLWVNCSNTHKSYNITVDSNKTKMSIDLDELPYNTPQLELEVFEHELDKQYTLFCIKDKGLRNKVEFEHKLQDLEKENIELKEQLSAFREKFENIKRLI